MTSTLLPTVTAWESRAKPPGVARVLLLLLLLLLFARLSTASAVETGKIEHTHGERLLPALFPAQSTEQVCFSISCPKAGYVSRSTCRWECRSAQPDDLFRSNAVIPGLLKATCRLKTLPVATGMTHSSRKVGDSLWSCAAV